MNLAEDGNLSLDYLREVYNADLANGLGNLVSRVATLCEKASVEVPVQDLSIDAALTPKLRKPLEKFQFNRYLELVWAEVAEADKYVAENKPWEYLGDASKQDALTNILNKLVGDIYRIAVLVEPFIPEASNKIQEQFRGPKIKSTKPLFPRL